MAESSPFPFQGPLDPGQGIGRADLRQDLAQRLADHRLTALLGPRRYGKTTLLKQVAADLVEVGPQTVWVDLYELTSLADLAGAFDRGLAATRGPLRRSVDKVAGSLSVSVGAVGIQLSGRARDRPDPALALRSLLQVLVRTAQRQPTVLVLDEFSGIAGVDGAAGILRTELQHHFQTLGIVFAGSQPGTMRTLFADQAQPFFAQADLVEIGPLLDDEVIEIVQQGFSRTGRDAGGAVGPIVALADGHPQRAMQLADATWRRVEPGAEATDRDWEEALAEVRASVDSGSERLFELLATGHQKVLRAVASGGSPYGRAGTALSLSPGTAQAGVRALLGTGYLTERDGAVSVVDPLLADWIRRRFPV